MFGKLRRLVESRISGLPPWAKRHKLLVALAVVILILPPGTAVLSVAVAYALLTSGCP